MPSEILEEYLSVSEKAEKIIGTSAKLRAGDKMENFLISLTCRSRRSDSGQGRLVRPDVALWQRRGSRDRPTLCCSLTCPENIVQKVFEVKKT
eukprot:379895-Hanusia_phi.AAC.3